MNPSIWIRWNIFWLQYFMQTYLNK
jgi:hypothetical protein